MGIEVTSAAETDVAELADVAARTFPLACPPAVTADNIAAFIAENLSEARFRDYLRDPDRTVLVARDDGVAGYAMLIRGVPDDDDVQRAVTARPAVEVSKIYVLPERHGGGVAAALMEASLHAARRLGAAVVWLGVNQQNRRAQRFYAKQGFEVAGTKTFRLGAAVENDFVMVRPV
ncbi:GNAT family N-acetyltransferase [Mycolicibacterium flavescens]|uniref:GNAT family N-acetyltransferase n=1 Tax=Mycolicibacterium flavescens TaxID=1776 RepID=A0A1E3RBN8_MYCFV|nr:GNAT family N-acetyltransferase [Mycolicibacterium flavescens]MCV7278647.1 GNAT family N-acetyltransferase [Mycolicibacterium flavescens]ODQ87308.1 GNAT family N-acetyltransferase [Mycolicibacterium flavescens]